VFVTDQFADAFADARFLEQEAGVDADFYVFRDRSAANRSVTIW